MSSYVCGTSDQPLLYQTVGETLERAAERWPARDALIIPQQNIRWSWRQLNEAADRLARGFLGLGLKPGDRIGIWSPNRVEWVVTQFASAKAGLILVTINPAYRINELESALNKVAASALVLAPSFKTSNYVAMIRQLAPELGTGVAGDLKLARLPHLRSLVLMGDEVVPGFIAYDSLSRDAGASDDLQQLATQLTTRRSHQHPVHERHDGLAERRDAHASQHRQQRLLRGAAPAVYRARPLVHSRAALSLFRHGHGCARLHDARCGDDLAGGRLRPACGPAGRRSRALHGAVWRTDDVHRRAGSPGIRCLRPEFVAHRHNGWRTLPGRDHEARGRADAHA